MSENQKKGKFIVLDGTDGSGKGTQTRLLIKKLKLDGYDVEYADFPQYDEPSSYFVREYLNGRFGSAKEVNPRAASIFYACDRFAASFKLRKLIDEGKIVICNRYASANMGHQTGKIHDTKERDKFLEWLFELEFNIFNIPKPDDTILIYMPPEIGQQLVGKKDLRNYIENGKKKDIHEEDINHLKEAAEAYQYVAKKYNWTVIDCAPDKKLRTIEDIQKEVYEKVKKIIEAN